MKEVTIEEVKNCIGFHPDSLMYKSLSGLCDIWYKQAQLSGKNNNDAAMIALDNLGKKIIEMSQKTIESIK